MVRVGFESCIVERERERDGMRTVSYTGGRNRKSLVYEGIVLVPSTRTGEDTQYRTGDHKDILRRISDDIKRIYFVY